MKRPYTYRTRSELGPKIWGMNVGDILLLDGFANGSVKSVVSRWAKRHKLMQFRTKKSSAGIIVHRLANKKRTYRRKSNGTA